MEPDKLAPIAHLAPMIVANGMGGQALVPSRRKPDEVMVERIRLPSSDKAGHRRDREIEGRRGPAN